MTTNQLRYHELEETKRKNSAAQAETNRHNLADELVRNFSAHTDRSRVKVQNVKDVALTIDTLLNSMSNRVAKPISQSVDVIKHLFPGLFAK